jgi:pyruvate dehydrogenase E1 component beta subunit
MPATATDARDLLIASVLSDDPVVYLDDRWLYGFEESMPPAAPVDLVGQGPRVVREGRDVTLVACGFTTQLCVEAAERLGANGVAAEVVDLRVLNPIDHGPAATSVRKTGRLLAVDGDWATCGVAAEVIAGVSERLPPDAWRAAPVRITLPDAPAPTSGPLEKLYYPSVDDVVGRVLALTGKGASNGR